jgi:hypothetical protein
VQPLNVLKKLRRFIAPTRSDPPTGVGVAGRAFSAAKLGTAPPNEPIGRSRYALPLAELPAHVYVRTPVMPVPASPPRSVLLAVSGLPPRPKRIGSGF